MKLASFINRNQCQKAAESLRTVAGFGGIDGELGEEIVVDGETCLSAARAFEDAHEKGGEYLCNIIKYPFFSLKDQSEIASYL